MAVAARIIIRCWKCDRVCAEVEGPVIGRVIIDCKRCHAKNVIGGER